jgi:hypothetical protein
MKRKYLEGIILTIALLVSHTLPAYQQQHQNKRKEEIKKLRQKQDKGSNSLVDNLKVERYFGIEILK